MIKSIALLSFLFLGACGNPHLTPEAEKERISPPIKPELPIYPEAKVDFFVGPHEVGYPFTGDISSGFKIGLRSLVSHSLDSLELGTFSVIEVLGSEVKIDFLHKTEERSVALDVQNFDSIFSAQDYDLVVKEPIDSEGVLGNGRGVDVDSFDALTKDAMVFKFSNPMKAFGGFFLDVESSTFTPAIMRAFDCQGKLVNKQFIVFAGNEAGQNQFHFLGFKSQNQDVCSFAVTVGDIDQQTGVYRGLMLDEVVYQE